VIAGSRLRTWSRRRQSRLDRRLARRWRSRLHGLVAAVGSLRPAAATRTNR